MTEAQFIKQARQQAGLTQAQIAKSLGWSSAQFLSNAERALCVLPIKAMYKFCKLTGADLNVYESIKVEKLRGKMRKARMTKRGR